MVHTSTALNYRLIVDAFLSDRDEWQQRAICQSEITLIFTNKIDVNFILHIAIKFT